MRQGQETGDKAGLGVGALRGRMDLISPCVSSSFSSQTSS